MRVPSARRRRVVARLTRPADPAGQVGGGLAAAAAEAGAGPAALVEAIRADSPLLPLAGARARADELAAGAHRFGPIGRFLVDDAVTEILVNGPGPVTVERAGRLAVTGVAIDAYQLDLVIERILAPLGLRVDRASPLVDARLADGSRVNIVVPPLAVDGPLLSIRRFPGLPPSLDTFGPPQLVHLLRQLVAQRATVLVTGPTSSGKTTLVAALGRLIDPSERVVCIEDTAELRLAGPNVARLEARPANAEGVGEVPLRRLVLNALRMRPDRLIVGEVRGGEALDLLLALTSGHRGGLTTCHGRDAAGALARLETLAGLSGSPVAPGRLRRLVHDGIDVVVTTARTDGRRSVVAVDRLGGGRLEPLWPPIAAHSPVAGPVAA